MKKRQALFARVVGWLFVVSCLLSPVSRPWVWAAVAAFPEDAYTAAQSAFLREEFQKVVRMVEPLIPALAFDFNQPQAVVKTTRMWLWYALSLERLQRIPDALRAIDHIKAGLSNCPSSLAKEAGLEALWPEVSFWDGEISRKGLKLVRARLAYQRLLNEFPQSPWRTPAQFGLGLALFQQQAYEAALEPLQDVVQTALPASPTGRDAMILTGLCHLQLTHFEDAGRIFRELAEQAGEEPDVRARVLFYLGETLTGMRRFEDAARVYQQAIDADPSSPWALSAQFGLGWSLFQQHRCRESLQAVERYHARAGGAPPRLDLLFAKGRCLMELGEDAKAAACFEQIRHDDPEHMLAIDATLSLAELYQRQQRLTEAMALVDDVLRQAFEPDQLAQANVRLGSLYLAQGEATKALAQFRSARDTAQRDLRQAALNGLGDTYLFLGNLEEAGRWYQAAIGQSPTTQAAWYAAYQLARLQLQAGRVEEAIQGFRSLSTRPLQPTWPGEERAGRELQADARLALAFAYLSSAHQDLARAELEQIQQEDPASPHAVRAGYYLALLALNEGRFTEVQRLCEDVIERVPSSDEALEARMLLADVVATRSSAPEALAMLEASVPTLQELPGRHRGRLARKLGDLARQADRYAKAIRWYEAAWEALPSQRGELEYRLASCYEEGGDLALAVSRYRAITQAPWAIRGQLAAAKLMEREERWQDARAIYEAMSRQPVPEAKIARERLSSLGEAGP